MKKTTEFKDEVIHLASHINPTQDQEFYDRFLQLKDKHSLVTSRLMKKLLRDWVEQQLKEKNDVKWK